MLFQQEHMVNTGVLGKRDLRDRPGEQRTKRSMVVRGIMGQGWGVEGPAGTYNAPEHFVPTAEGDRQHGGTLLCIERHPSLLIHCTWGQRRGNGS